MNMQMGSKTDFCWRKREFICMCRYKSHCALLTIFYDLQNYRIATIKSKSDNQKIKNKKQRTLGNPWFFMKHKCFPKNLHCFVFFYIIDGLLRTHKDALRRLRKTNFTMFTHARNRTMRADERETRDMTGRLCVCGGCLYGIAQQRWGRWWNWLHE